MANPLANVKPSPRVKMAARLYATGACKTKREASRVAGLHPNYLTMLTQPSGGSESVKHIVNETDAMLENEAVEESVILRKLGRQALKALAGLLHSDNLHVRFKAAQDLADRSPHVAKTQKVQIESLTLSGQDVQELARALTESHKRSDKFDQVVSVGLIEVPDIPTKELPSGVEASGVQSSSVEDRQEAGSQ